jgi:hypothetical protein
MHVSSVYAHAPTWQEYNYIEAGISADPDDYPQAFVAWENYPVTPRDHRYQRQVWGALHPLNSWVYCEINNHQLGGSNWYAAVGGQTLLHGMALYRGDTAKTPCTQVNIRSTGERWHKTGCYENWTSTYLLKMKDSRGNWYDWSNLVTEDCDLLWNPYKVSNTYWYTVKAY